MNTAVLWDFGGVITTSPLAAFRRFEHERNLPTNFISTINSTNPDTNAWARFERSEISIEEFDAAFYDEAIASGAPLSGREVLALLVGDIRPSMVNALRMIKARGIRQACITNNVKNGEGAMARTATQTDEVAHIMDIFDHVIESAKIGIRKPDPQIYMIACEALDITPQQAIFLDDLGINLKPARAMGMRTIKVSDPDQALNALESYLGFALSS